MNLLEILPGDVIVVLIEILSGTSFISVIVMARVSKLCYKLSSKCAIRNKINRHYQCNEIASEGSLEILKWARSKGYEWNSSTCAYAAQNGHLEVLKWARSNGCEWDSDTCYWAARNGHLDRKSVV